MLQGYIWKTRCGLRRYLYSGRKFPFPLDLSLQHPPTQLQTTSFLYSPIRLTKQDNLWHSAIFICRKCPGHLYLSLIIALESSTYHTFHTVFCLNYGQSAGYPKQSVGNFSRKDLVNLYLPFGVPVLLGVCFSSPFRLLFGVPLISNYFSVSIQYTIQE